MRRQRLIVTAAALAFVLGITSRPSCAQKQQGTPQTKTSWPTKDWMRATPHALGVNVAALDSIDADIKSGAFGYIDRMLVIRHGRLIYDRMYRQNYDSAYRDSIHVRGALNSHDFTSPYNYYNPWWHPFYHRGDLHSLQSVTKSITSMIIGSAVTRGDFPSLDTPVLSFFDTSKVANIDERKRRMTVRHLMTMTSGLDWNEGLPYTDPRNTAIGLEESGDWVKYTIDRPMAVEPGTVFNYNSGATAVLAHVFFQATGIDIEEYAARYLFSPLGIERWFWKRGPTGLADTEGGLYLEARDLAKLWYLLSKQGEWDGHQVLSRDWVRASTSPSVAIGGTGVSYGFGLFLRPWGRDSTHDSVGGSGFGGQLPFLLPDEDMIVVFNGWNILPGRAQLPFRQIVARISASVTGS